MFFKYCRTLTLSLALLLGACACQHSQKSTTVPSESGKKTEVKKSSDDKTKIDSPANVLPDDLAGYSIPKSQRVVKAKDLFNALAKVDRLKSIKGTEITVTGYDVFCEMNPMQEKLLCRMNSRPENTKGGQRVDFNALDSEKLFALMSYLPISKGDGGLSTEFVQCRRAKIEAAGADDHYGCSVAAPIQYVPHSGMSPLVEGED